MQPTSSRPSPRKHDLVVYRTPSNQPRLARVVRAGRHDLTLRTLDRTCPLVVVGRRDIVEVVREDKGDTHRCGTCGRSCTARSEECYSDGWGPEPVVVWATLSDCCDGAAEVLP